MRQTIEEVMEQTIEERGSLLVVAQEKLDLSYIKAWLWVNDHDFFVLSNDIDLSKEEKEKKRKGESRSTYIERADVFYERYQEAKGREESVVVFDMWSPEWAWTVTGETNNFWKSLRLMERLYLKFFERIKGEKAIIGLCNDVTSNPLKESFGCVYSAFDRIYDQRHGQPISLKL